MACNRRHGAARMALVTAAALGIAGCGGGLPSRRTSTPIGPTPTERPVPTTTPTPTSPTTGPTPSTPPTSTPATTPPVTLPLIGAGRPATALLRAALTDAAAAGWTQTASRTVSSQAGIPPTIFTSVDGPDQGTQDITFGTLTGSIRVVGTRTYVRGTPEALVNLFDIPGAVAGRLGGLWVVLTPADSNYHTVTIGVTLPSVLTEIAFRGPVRFGAARLAGQPTTVIEGRLAPSVGSGVGALYVTVGAHPLPVAWRQVTAATATAPATSTDTVYARWGRPAAVTAPAGAVPLPATPGGTSTATRIIPHVG